MNDSNKMTKTSNVHHLIPVKVLSVVPEILDAIKLSEKADAINQ